MSERRPQVTFEEFYELATSPSIGFTILSKKIDFERFNSKTKVKVMKNGRAMTKTWVSLSQGIVNTYGDAGRTHSTEDVKRLFLNKGLIFLAKEYNDNQTSYQFECEYCGSEGSSSLHDVKRKDYKTGCASCTHALPYFEQNVASCAKMGLLLLVDFKDYTKTNRRYVFRCSSCEYKFKANLKQILEDGFVCPKCNSL